MQYVEVELDPGESAVAEAGAMMYMTNSIQMETIFGDGSERKQAGLVGSLLGAGKRLLTGESLFMTVFTNSGSNLQRVAFAAPYAGKILAMDLSTLGGELICQKDAFPVRREGRLDRHRVSKEDRRRALRRRGVYHAASPGRRADLSPRRGYRPLHGASARATRCAWTPVVWSRYSRASATTSSSSGASRRHCSGGEGLFFANVAGPGRVWLQSLPLSRLADRIYKAAPQTGGRRPR